MLLVRVQELIRLLGGGFKHFLFSSLLGEDSNFDLYFSNGLKPPTRLAICLELLESHVWKNITTFGFIGAIYS